MMIAARLAGGNLFFAFFVVGGLLGALGAARSTRIFLRGILWWGIFGSTRSTRSTRIFFEGILLGGDSFFWGVVGCVLDCKCWKKLKND